MTKARTIADESWGVGVSTVALVACVIILQGCASAPSEPASGVAEAKPSLPGENEELRPPIPVRFNLAEPGVVTLVIDDANGVRVRNLVMETSFPAGENVVWWDGLDETSVNFRVCGVYDILPKLVEPGIYRVRGIVHKGINVRYQMAAYNAGDPPWPLPDGRGRWMADHSPPSDALFLPPGRAPHYGVVRDAQWRPDEKQLLIPTDQPLVLLCSHVAESGDGIVWADLSGRKVRGVKTFGVGGGWCGAQFLARDVGDKAPADTYAYNATFWKNWLEVRSMPQNKQVFHQTFKDEKSAQCGGMAVRNGLVVLSMTGLGELHFIDAATGKKQGAAPIESPRGAAFDAQGRLLLLSGTRLLRVQLPPPAAEMKLPEPEVLVGQGLEDPKRIALDAEGNIYVSDWGGSHQVKVFAPEGKPLRVIGSPGGGSRLGPYDPTRMQNPNGLAVTGDGRLWVAESCYAPKRVSIWTLEGKLVKALYGPPGYGGGGSLDPVDRTRFYLAQGGTGMEFRLNWDAGSSELVRFYYLGGEGQAIPGLQGGWHPAPQMPVYLRGRQYMTNAFTDSPGATGVAGIWLMRDGLAVPVAAAGQAGAWDLLKEPQFKARLPENVDPREVLFVWSDLNGDARPQPDEVSARHLKWAGSKWNGRGVGAIYLGPSLDVTTSGAFRLAPRSFTPGGAPVYNMDDARRLVPDLSFHWVPYETLSAGAWAIAKGEPMRGYRAGKLLWTYPNQWPELHAALREAPPAPPRPGQMVGTMRVQGHPVNPPGSEAGDVFAITGYYGQTYLISADGMFVASLFKDCRETGYFNAYAAVPKAERGALLNGVSLQAECFFDTITQAADGAVYLQTGKSQCTLARLEGLETIRRLPERRLRVTGEHLAAAERCFELRAERDIKARGRGVLKVAIRKQPPVVDGKLDDWADAEWVTMANTEFRANKGANPVFFDHATAALAVAGDRLYAAFRTEQPELLKNSVNDLRAMFARGGSLNLMVGADAAADPNRREPARGDARLVVSVVEGQPRAILYRPVAQKGQSGTFHSSWRELTFGAIEDVGERLQLAAVKGEYELSLPLAALGIQPKPGLELRGDVGIVIPVEDWREAKHMHRVFWHDTSVRHVADVVGEAMLRPALWGTWEFVAQ